MAEQTGSYDEPSLGPPPAGFVAEPTGSYDEPSLGPPPAGFVAEQTGSYDETFYMTGALLIVASLLGFLATVWGKWSCHAGPNDESNSYRPADSVDT